MTTIRSRFESSLHVERERVADLERQVAALAEEAADYTFCAWSAGLTGVGGIGLHALIWACVFGAAFAVALARLVVIRGRLTRLRGELARADGRAEAFEEVLLCRWVEVVRGEGRGKRETKRADRRWL